MIPTSGTLGELLEQKRTSRQTNSLDYQPSDKPAPVVVIIIVVVVVVIAVVAPTTTTYTSC
jgi:hypothetical protein